MPGNSSHDTLDRRKRIQRFSTGKRITPQERDLLWFRKIHEHGPLSSSALHGYSRNVCRSEKRARDRLTDLFHEENTQHGGAYLSRPWQQFRTFDARYRELVYGLEPAAELTLKQYGLWQAFQRTHSGAWWHNQLVASITASIEQSSNLHSGLAYIPQHQILGRAKTTLRFPVPVMDRSSSRKRVVDLVPDALFGLEYRDRGKSTYRFFVLEVDRSTEPSVTSNFNRKSHLRNFLQYQAYIGDGLYRKHLKLTAPLLVLNVCTSEAVMKRMLKLVNERFPGLRTLMLFNSIGFFPPSRLHGKDSPDFLNAGWVRANLPHLRIRDGAT